MRTILVYKAEQEAGLAERLQQERTLAWCSPCETGKLGESSGLILHRLRTQAAERGEQPDLHPLKGLLVSTGWNLNDDVFDPTEVWAARATPEDKPFNYEHDCADVIGHITGNEVVDDAGKSIADDTSASDLPEKFHILTAAVLYKVWAKEELQKRMDTLLGEIAQGKWYLSMEALFYGFDYAAVDKQGKHSVIARNDKTAFLTKHLRAYGGDGKYGDYKLGRLLRNVVFSGKGLVKKPANPASVIFASSAPFSSCYAALVYGPPAQTIQGVKTVTTEALEKQLADLKTENDSLRVQLRDGDVKKLTAERDQWAAQAKATEDARAKAAADLADAKKEVESLNKALADEKVAHKGTLEKLAAAESTLTAQARIAKFVAKLGEDSRPRADEFVKNTAGMSDIAFDSALETVASMKPSLPPQATSAPTPPKGTPAPTPPRATGSADPVNLDTATSADQTPPVHAPTEPTGVEAVRLQVAEAFGCENK